MNATSTVDAPLRAAARQGVLGLLVLVVVAAVVATLTAGTPGLWGALLGAAVGGAFVLFTVAVILATAGSSPTVAGGVLMGTWLLKLVALLVVVALLRKGEFYDHTSFGVVVIVAAVGLLAVETWAVIRTRVPYVDPADPVSDKL